MFKIVFPSRFYHTEFTFCGHLVRVLDLDWYEVWPRNNRLTHKSTKTNTHILYWKSYIVYIWKYTEHSHMIWMWRLSHVCRFARLLLYPITQRQKLSPKSVACRNVGVQTRKPCAQHPFRTHSTRQHAAWCWDDGCFIDNTRSCAGRAKSAYKNRLRRGVVCIGN